MVAGSGPEDEETTVIIDCDECVMQATSACEDCIVPVLLGRAPSGAVPGRVELDEDEQTALTNLADAGMVAPLRLVRRAPEGEAAAG